MKKKNLPLDKFIEWALYDKKSGYYMKKDPFGKKGDYITSPNISVLFSEMIAIWCVSYWEHKNCPDKVKIIELGAGNGEMLNQIILTIKQFPKFYKSCKFYIFEKSKYLKGIQKKKLSSLDVQWINSIKEKDQDLNIFLANEFFDALPVKQFTKIKKKWYEKNIRINSKNHFETTDVLYNIDSLKKTLGFDITEKQTFIEFSPLLFKILRKIGKNVNNSEGGLLIIDYGTDKNKMKNTVKSIFKHKTNFFLNNVSNADITYNLNYNLIKKIVKNLNLKVGGFSNQGTFLKNLGILQRGEIISKNLPFSKKADIFYRINRLINKNQMGELFKVLFITSKKNNFKGGFY